jgi:acyl carrier protein
MDIENNNEQQLKQQIKHLIITECDKEDDFDVSDITDLEPLFGRKSKLSLDSLDALQLSLALKKKFSINIEGSKESRKHMMNVQSIYELIIDSSNR